ncbi:PAS domain-containing protein [Apiospora arundinis]
MDSFFGTQLSQEELQRRHAQQGNQRRAMNSGIRPSLQHYISMSLDTAMVGAGSLDDIIHSSHQELQRRRGVPMHSTAQIPLDQKTRAEYR